MIYCRCSIHKHVVQNESTRGKTKIILLTLEMARQVISRTTHIEKGELRVTHENAILTNVTPANPSKQFPCPICKKQFHLYRECPRHVWNTKLYSVGIDCFRTRRRTKHSNILSSISAAITNFSKLPESTGHLETVAKTAPPLQEEQAKI